MLKWRDCWAWVAANEKLEKGESVWHALGFSFVVKMKAINNLEKSDFSVMVITKAWTEKSVEVNRQRSYIEQIKEWEEPEQ